MRETPLAEATFAQYCALGPQRSLAKLARELGKPSGYTRQLEAWSSAFAWQERARDHDREQAEKKRLQRESEIARMDDEHALMGRTQALRAVKQIQELIEAKKFGSQAAVQLLKVATDLERLARGGATDRQEITGKDGETLAHRVVFVMPEIEEVDE